MCGKNSLSNRHNVWTSLPLKFIHLHCVRLWWRDYDVQINHNHVCCSTENKWPKTAKLSSKHCMFCFRLLTPALHTIYDIIAITETIRLGKSLFRKRSDKMRKELEDAAREGSSRRSNSPIPALLPNDRTSSLSDLTGTAKAAGFYSDGLPKTIHMKFVRKKTQFASPFFCSSEWLYRLFCNDQIDRTHTMAK